MRRTLTVIASMSMALIVGCGGSGHSLPGSGGEKQGHRQKANFALAKEVCEHGPKTDFAVRSVGIPADSGDHAIAIGYATQWPANDQEAAQAGCLAGLKYAPARFPSSAPSARGIWGRNFLVRSITLKATGEDLPVVEPFRVRFWFSSERDHGVSWKARCNSTSADAHFTARRIKTHWRASTAIGCPPGPGREDAWVDRFMRSNPEWRLRGDDLRLTTDSATVDLRGFTDPNKCVIPPNGGWIDVGDSGFDCESALNLVTLYVEGADSYYPEWDCQKSGSAAVVRCNDGKRLITVHGFDQAFYERQKSSFED